jgi:hypothetical protein
MPRNEQVQTAPAAGCISLAQPHPHRIAPILQQQRQLPFAPIPQQQQWHCVGAAAIADTAA